MNKKRDNMNAIPKSMEGILKDNPKMRIPIFQRDYSWKRDNWKELWNDIKIGFSNDCKHYLGSIVLVENDDFMEVVDGQQRLTTISLLYLAIISNFNELINNKIDVQQNITRSQDIKKLICETNLYDISSTNKLQLNENNNMVYSEYLVKDKLPSATVNLTSSNKLLVDCFKYFKREIKKACTEEGEKNQSFKLLLDYYRFICDKLIIIEITASDYNNAYVIFETLNDRGLDLTVTDLLKNYLFSKIDSSRHPEIKKYWNDIIKNVDEKNATKFIRHYWNSYNTKVTEKGLFKIIKENLYSQDKIIKFINKLNEVSEIYKSLSEPKSNLWNGDKILVQSLKEIKLYGVDLCYPVLLAAQNNLSNLKLKQKIFRLCSNISFRYIVICNGSANDLERAYNTLCLKINNDKDSLDFSKVTKDLKEFLVPRDEFIASFTNKIIKTKNNKRLITYILKGIERNRGSEIKEDHTIEHILPEKYNQKWNEIFNNEAEEYIYRLGNYVLLEKEVNSDIGNELFENKKVGYNKSVYSGPHKISSFDKWTSKELKKHQQEMGKIAECVWSL
ncbi:DUF262 domain-containing protein [Clostridium sporogenes]|nr:DUF262 domain-containing protein [Clostridium sporogenes]SUY62450.1 Uncharacterized conserved protein [Clostridium sporogenes]